MRSWTLFATFFVSLAAYTAVSADKIPAAGGDIEITPIMHASVQVEHAGTVIQIDPWSSGDLSRAKAADLILVTSADRSGHHLDPDAIQRLRKPGSPVVIPAMAKARVPYGTVLANGEAGTFSGINVQAIAAYDIKIGEPTHPKGVENGYLITVGGKRIYFAGVTECVPEMQALKGVDVAFIPMNLPLQRMTPTAVAECLKTFKPRIVYPYHFDQEYTARLKQPEIKNVLPSANNGYQALKDALKGETIELRLGNWYPPVARD